MTRRECIAILAGTLMPLSTVGVADARQRAPRSGKSADESPSTPAPAPPTAIDEPRLRQLHRHRAGIYYRLSEREQGANVDHPLVDAVVTGVRWREVEPKPGEFDFRKVRSVLEQWGKAGKGVVPNLILYGQGLDDMQTPPWVYDAGVEAIAFAGGGRAKGQAIRIPKVWDDAFVTKRLEPLEAALAPEFDGDSRIRYVMAGFGHNGNLVAQPSKDGAPAMQKAGWTPEKWGRYCTAAAAVYRKHFQKTPLVAKAVPKLLRTRAADHYVKEENRILADIGRSGVALIALGMENDLAQIREIHARLAPVADLARRGATRLGMGDDWPLWVPEARRDKAPTRGRDETVLRAMLTKALAGGEGLAAPPITMLFVQEPEITASHPKGGAYRPAVHDALKEARDRMKRTDAEIYGA
jgi:hypothetical protein